MSNNKKFSLKSENMHNKVSAKHSFTKYFILYLIIFFFIPIFNAYILLIAFNSNIFEETYEKDYDTGNVYLTTKLLVKNQENYGLSYSYDFELKSAGDVESINFTNINLKLCINKYLIGLIKSTPYYGSQHISGGRGYPSITLDYNDNITLVGTITIEFNFQGDYRNETFNLNIIYEITEPTWLQRYGVFIIITIQIIFLSIFILSFYFPHKRKISKNNY